MDPIQNPYSPGAGTPPPALVGRDDIREKVRITFERIRIGNPAKSLILIGLRGVGKTVLLHQMSKDAEASGIHTIYIETPEKRSLPALLVPGLRTALMRLSRVEAAKALAQRSLQALAGFIKGLKIKYKDLEVYHNAEKPEPGLADNGDLENDLTALFEQVGKTAQQAKTALGIFIDELQYIPNDQLAALISALHRCAQLKLPITMVGAGLPHLRGLAGNAKTYAERLFDYPEIGPLDEQTSQEALTAPAEKLGVCFTPDAIKSIVDTTHGYPYFLQEWGKHVWDIAQTSPISIEDVQKASEQTIATLDESFFLVRFDRMTAKEKHYLRAMAELGAGPHRSGTIAQTLGRHVSGLGTIRESLISKGMIWSPSHGDTAFTAPLFDEFMRRIIPNYDEYLKEF